MDVERVKRLAIRPGSTGRYFERVLSGEVVSLQVDTAWSIFHRLKREEVLHYLDIRKSQGFNVILGVLLAELEPLDGVLLGPDGSRKIDSSAAIGEKGGTESWFYPNRYGEVPLLNDDPATPNPKYFDHVDWVINSAAERGMLVGLVPSWARFVNKGWTFGPVLFNPSSARAYGGFLGARYPFLPKLLGGDSNPHWIEPGGMEIWKRLGAYREAGSKGSLPRVDDIPRSDSSTIWDAMAEGLLSSETPFWADWTVSREGQRAEEEERIGGGKPVITYHPTALWLPDGPPALASAYWNDRPWLTMDGCQSGHADYPNVKVEPSLKYWDARASHVPLAQMWRRNTVRPIIDLEPHYEGMYNGIMAREKMWDADDVRAGAWQSMLSGACGVVYGHNAVWQMYDPERAQNDETHKPVCGLDGSINWKDALHDPGPSHVRILTSFFQSLPSQVFHGRRPAQDLLISSEAPFEWADRDARVDVMVSEVNGATFMLLAHSGYGYAFTLDLSTCNFATGIKAEWLDPRTGKLTAIGSVGRGRERFTPPSKGSVKDNWVLVVRA